MSEEVKKSEVKRKRGAPEGNQNARKHGFYSQCLDPKELEDLSAAAKVYGLDQEIAILRETMLSILKKEPRNDKLIVEAIGTMDRLFRTNQRLESRRRLFSDFKGQSNRKPRSARPPSGTIVS